MTPACTIKVQFVASVEAESCQMIQLPRDTMSDGVLVGVATASRSGHVVLRFAAPVVWESVHPGKRNSAGCALAWTLAVTSARKKDGGLDVR